MIEIELDSRNHLAIECRWPGAHRIHPRTCLVRIIYFRDISRWKENSEK